jgi:transposase
MGEVSTIGVDIAKSVFQVHGVDADGAVVIRRRVGRAKVLEFFAETATLPCWHGSVRNGPPVGTRAQEAWA